MDNLSVTRLHIVLRESTMLSDLGIKVGVKNMKAWTFAFDTNKFIKLVNYMKKPFY